MYKVDAVELAATRNARRSSAEMVQADSSDSMTSLTDMQRIVLARERVLLALDPYFAIELKFLEQHGDSSATAALRRAILAVLPKPGTPLSSQQASLYVFLLFDRSVTLPFCSSRFSIIRSCLSCCRLPQVTTPHPSPVQSFRCYDIIEGSVYECSRRQ